MALTSKAYMVYFRQESKKMTYAINKSKAEKIQDTIRAKEKADYDIVLYYHFQSIKDEIYKDIDNIQ